MCAACAALPRTIVNKDKRGRYMKVVSRRLPGEGNVLDPVRVATTGRWRASRAREGATKQSFEVTACMQYPDDVDRAGSRVLESVRDHPVTLPSLRIISRIDASKT
jgi:hypothetical protein